MTTLDKPNFGVKFPSRQERAVKSVTKCETHGMKKSLSPSKPIPARSSSKSQPVKKAKPPATLVKPTKPPRVTNNQVSNGETKSVTTKINSHPRTLQPADLEKIARLNCSREFSLFHQYIKSELPKKYENHLAFLETKLQHLKNEFVNKQAEHLNFQQIKEYYEQARTDHIRRQLKPDEYLTLLDKYKEDIRQAVDKWIRKKEFKPPKQVNLHLQRRQQRVRDKVKETIQEQKRQQKLDEATENRTESSITISRTSTLPVTTRTVDDDDDIMIID